MKSLRPLVLPANQIEFIEREIQRLFNELIYYPLLRAARLKPDEELQNAAHATYLARAVSEGLVWQQDGRIYGSFNSKITKELKALGAKYDARSKAWTIPEVPAEVQMAQAVADSRYSAIRHQVIQTLEDMKIESIDRLSTTKDRYRETIDWIEGDFQKTVSAISIPPQLTPKQRDIIAEQWGQNLDLYIKDWAAENILELRGKVQANTFEGRRAEQLVDMIQKSYGTSKKKAKFLARQETGLLMSRFQQTRYEDIGIKRYRWSGANDARERADHKLLNGKVFAWDSPPVTNRKTGAKNHPGADFGCRCIAIPLVE